MATFQDLFSKQASDYARYRPVYPGELFDYLASVTPDRRLAWDCGTGSGQAALELAKRFERVVATDASAEQVAQAAAHPQIDYRVERAEEISLEPHSVDLVTVAIAVHWFDLERFYQAVRRVSAPGGVLAVWTYHLPLIEAQIDRILYHYYHQVLGGYWAEPMHYVDEGYQTLPFPFNSLQPPEFDMHTEWDLEHLVGFLNSWSANRKYQQERGQHPLEAIWGDLTQAWGPADQQRSLRWPFHIKVGRVTRRPERELRSGFKR